MGVEGHGGRVERGKGGASGAGRTMGPRARSHKVGGWPSKHGSRHWGHGARSHGHGGMGSWGSRAMGHGASGGWPSKHGDIGGHTARSHGAMEAWVHGVESEQAEPGHQDPKAWVHGGPWESTAMEGGWSGGRAEQAERAERAGMHWGPLKSFDWV